VTEVPALLLRNVRVRRGRREVLRIDQLAIARGETLGVLGPNGAGKSTLLLTAALLLPSVIGEIELFGERAGRGRTAIRQRRLTATVFQEPALLDMSVRRNIEVALALHDVPRAERARRCDYWLQRLGVRHLEGALPHTLSGGEAQRVALARAFAVAPRLLFLDEPFSSLDPATRAELVGELRALLREEDVTAVFVTHDLTEVRLMADRALVLDGGEVIQCGPVEQLFARPAGARVAAFLGYAVVPASALPPGIVDAAGVSAAATVAIRPSAVLVTNPGDEVPASDLALATVAAVQGAHGRARLLLDFEGGRIAAELGVQEALDRHVGDQVRVTIDPAGVIPL